MIIRTFYRATRNNLIPAIYKRANKPMTVIASLLVALAPYAYQILPASDRTIASVLMVATGLVGLFTVAMDSWYMLQCDMDMERLELRREAAQEAARREVATRLYAGKMKARARRSLVNPTRPKPMSRSARVFEANTISA